MPLELIGRGAWFINWENGSTLGRIGRDFNLGLTLRRFSSCLGHIMIEISLIT